MTPPPESLGVEVVLISAILPGPAGFVSIYGFIPALSVLHPPAQPSMGLNLLTKYAVTNPGAVILTVHVPVTPAQSAPAVGPLTNQRLRVKFRTGVAVRVTFAFTEYDSEQSVPQEIPVGLGGGLDVIGPLLAGSLATLRISLKVAVTVPGAVILMVHVPVFPAQPAPAVWPLTIHP